MLQGQKILTNVQGKGAELDEAIEELNAQMDGGAERLARLEHWAAIES